MNELPEIKLRLKNIYEDIQKSNTTKRTITLIGASKGQSLEKILSAHSAGLRDFGENYLQEAIIKIKELDSKLSRNTYSMHFIGKIQSKKSKQIAHLFDRVHSLDSIKAASLMNDELKTLKKIMPTLVEVNISELPQRGGVNPSLLPNFIKDLQSFDFLQVDGLMCLTSNDSLEIRKKQFLKMNALLKEINGILSPQNQLTHLSMGMSEDFSTAIECGATMVRIGSKLFGERIKIGN